jgi:PKD repeat protein
VAYVFSLNQSPTSYGDAGYQIKEFLKTLGGTITKSGTGTAGSYNASGDSIVSATFATAKAWYVCALRGGGQLCVQTGGSNAWRVKYSHTAGFVGGSPAADQTPTATDEAVLKGGGTDAAPAYSAAFAGAAYPHNLQLVGDNVTGSFIAIGHLNSASTSYGLPSSGIFLDRLVPGSYSTDDPCPVVWGQYGANVDVWTVTVLSSVSAGNPPAARYPNGTVNAASMLRYAESSSPRIPGATVDQYSGAELSWPVAYGRASNAFTGAAGHKGQSALFEWVSRENVSFGTLATIAGRNRLILGDVHIPWDGSTVPTNCTAVWYGATKQVGSQVLGQAIAQTTAGQQPVLADGPLGASPRSLDFDGTDDNIFGPAVQTLDLAALQGEWTIEALINPDALKLAPIIAVGVTGSEVAAANIQASLWITATGQIRAEWESGVGTDQQFTTAATPVTATAWQRVAIVKNGTHVRFYQNGTYLEQAAWATAPGTGTSARVYIAGFDSAFFDGKIRDIYVTGKALTDGEISARDTIAAADGEFPYYVGGLTWDRFVLGDQPVVEMRAVFASELVARFTADNTVLSVAFTDASTGGGGVASWSWNFGDAGTSTSQNPTHVYAASGEYTVSLTVTDLNGVTANYTTKITVSDGSVGDAVAPVITIVSPAAGGNVYADTIVTLDVTDETGLALVAILAVCRDSDGNVVTEDIVHDGDAFRQHYQSMANTRTAIADGYRFTIRRDDGWTGSPTFEYLILDAGGNFAEVAP